MLCYRLSGADGRRRVLLAVLDAVRTVHEDGPLTPDGLADVLDEEQRRADAAVGGPPFVGDVVFALAHDLQWSLRPPELPTAPRAARPHGPLAVLARIGSAAVYDETERTVRTYGRHADELAAVVRAGARDPGPQPPPGAPLTRPLTWLDAERYERQLALAKRYFDKGDVYQAVVSVQVRVRPHAPVHAYFATIAERYDSATYAYWLSAAGTRFFGACSLPHVMVADGRIRTRVFAGTAPADDGTGSAIRRLREDPKYFSEHVMLVDLERNDIGSLALPGRVRTERLLEPLVIGPTTYLATDVLGELPPGTGLGAALLGTFPRGVVVGAPKLRAQEVVAELEERPRGFYSGALGIYRAGTRSVVSNTIVTCGEIEGDDVVLSCGGGVTNESTAAQELSELALKLAYLR
ncbi:hypothetical protein BFF78_15745 [Streptomyces fodineus]|uniref:Chorismate-utilising enzyme C-terminal domain-containing protein n=1 Tax=Streptomyces fodineus TaxID=1904616 RepID=A0A1D7Y9L9_9ACTN|nr:hypothetical protein BFF78_15745 [Streptomyces fodineus]